MASEHNTHPFKVEAIDIDRQLAFARAARDTLLKSGAHSFIRYYGGRPYTVYTPAYIAACNRVIALEKQAVEIVKRHWHFGFVQNSAPRAAILTNRLVISENKND